MKNHVCVVIWLVCHFCCGYGVIEKEIVGNPDDTAKIERPCPTYDLNCIRGFIEKHAHCKKTFGPVPDPIYRAEDNVYIPRLNTSFTVINEINNGLNGRIYEFYINLATDRLVFAVEFQNFTQTTDQLYFMFHRRAAEPVVIQAAGTITYDSTIVTAVVPKLDDLQLQDAECTAFLNGVIRRIALTPTNDTITDPQVAVAFSRFLAELPVNTQEIFLTESAYLIKTFIQYNICDFGLLNTV